MREKVLVTGASGFIGRYLVDTLLENEYEVVALVHKSHVKNLPHITLLEGDICDRDIMKQAVRLLGTCDRILHLAADLDMQGSDETILVNCLGTYHMILLAKALKAKQFIYMSSTPVIGRPHIVPITESHPVAPRTLYHITKYTGEMMAMQLIPKEMHTVVLRISSPVGVGMGNKNYLSYLLEKCIKNEEIELYGTGARSQNYIDVRDIAESVLCSFSSSSDGIFLIAGKETVTNRELALLCKRVTGASSEIIWGIREDPEETDQWRISSEKARRLLGFSPQYSLEDTIRWIRNSMEAG